MALGYNYKIDREYFPGGQQLPTRGGAMDQQSPQSIGGILPPPDEEIQQVSNLTRQYYDKWFQLNNFAKAMQSNYGIDVTTPDFTNPNSMAANDIFMQGVADMYNQGNALRRGAKFENIYSTMAAQSPNVEYDLPEGQIATSQTLRDMRATQPLERGRDIAKAYSTQGETDAANVELDQLEESLRSRIPEVVESGDFNAIMNLNQQIQEISELKATYSDLQQQRLDIAKTSASRPSSGSETKKWTKRPERINMGKVGLLANTRKRMASGKNPEYSDIQYNPITGEHYLRPIDEGRSLEVYNRKDDPDGVIYNRMLNIGGDDSDISADQLLDLDMTRRPVPDQFDQARQQLSDFYDENVFKPAFDDIKSQIMLDPTTLQNEVFENSLITKSNPMFTAPEGLTIMTKAGSDPYVTRGGENIKKFEMWTPNAAQELMGYTPKVIVTVKDKIDGGTRELKLPLEGDGRLQSIQTLNKIFDKNAHVFFTGDLINEYSRALGLPLTRGMINDTGDTLQIGLNESAKARFIEAQLKELQ